MRLLAPLGFLGFIALALLILIYILRPDFKERVVSSTYIWKLSLKYRKKRSPFDMLKGSLLFFLQVLTVLLLVFALTRPAVTSSVYGREKIIVLDASASMEAESRGGTRFDTAKEKILALAGETVPENRVSVISASDNPRVEVNRDNRLDYIGYVLSALRCARGGADIDAAMGFAEDILARTPGAEVILITDCDYEKPGGVTVINVAEAEQNIAVLDFKSEQIGGYHVFSARIASYGKSTEVPAELFINGVSVASTVAYCADSVPQTVTFSGNAAKITDDKFEWARVSVAAADSFAYDNEFCLYRTRREKFEILYVSDSPFFMDSPLFAFPNANITLIPPGSAGGAAWYEGFDLYIFENYTPAQKPADGSVWVINPSASLPADFGFETGAEITFDTLVRLSSKAGGGRLYRQIMASVEARYIGVTRYRRAARYDGYERLLYCENDPVFFASSENGLKTFISTFDLRRSDLVMLPEFTWLVNNILSCALPDFVDKTAYDVGEEIVARPQGAGAERVILSDSAGTEVEAYEGAPAVFAVYEPGTYTLRQEKTAEGAAQKIYVRVPREESDFSPTREALKNPAAPAGGEGVLSAPAEDVFELVRYLAAGLLLLAVLERGLQYHEQR